MLQSLAAALEGWRPRNTLQNMLLYSKYFEYIVNIKNTISLPYVYSDVMIESHLDAYFLGKLNSDITRANLPAYKPVSVIKRNPFVNESELSALLTGIKVNYCKKVQTQGPGRNRVCPFCPGVVGRIGPPASEFHVTWVCPKSGEFQKYVRNHMVQKPIFFERN